MLGSVSQQHKILLYLIIKYAAKLAEMLKSEPSWGWLFFFFLVLFFFYCSVVLVLSAPEGVEQQRFLTALCGLLLCLLLMSKQNAGGTLLENPPGKTDMSEDRKIWKMKLKQKKKMPFQQDISAVRGKCISWLHSHRENWKQFRFTFFPLSLSGIFTINTIYVWG